MPNPLMSQKRDFNRDFFGGVAVMALPFVVGAIVAATGVKTVPGWLGVCYIVVSLVIMMVGFGLFLKSTEK